MTITEFDALTSSPRHGFPVAEYGLRCIFQHSSGESGLSRLR